MLVYNGILGMDVDENKTIIISEDEGYEVGDFANMTLTVWIKIKDIDVNIRDVRPTESIETTENSNIARENNNQDSLLDEVMGSPLSKIIAFMIVIVTLYMKSTNPKNKKG